MLPPLIVSCRSSLWNRELLKKKALRRVAGKSKWEQAERQGAKNGGASKRRTVSAQVPGTTWYILELSDTNLSRDHHGPPLSTRVEIVVSNLRRAGTVGETGSHIHNS